MSGIKPSRFGGSIGSKRTGANAALTAGGEAFGCTAIDLLDFATVGDSAAAMLADALFSAGSTVRTASNSAGEIKPLSLNNAAKRSRCSSGVPHALIDRPSAAVRMPFVTNIRTRASPIEGFALETPLASGASSETLLFSFLFLSALSSLRTRLLSLAG